MIEAQIKINGSNRLHLLMALHEAIVEIGKTKNLDFDESNSKFTTATCKEFSIKIVELNAAPKSGT